MAMIKIRIPYKYTSYPFSPEATMYSKKLAARKAKKTGVLFAMYGAFLMSIISILSFKLYPAVNESIFLLALALGIWAGLDLNPMINKWYEMRIQAALKNIDPKTAADLLHNREVHWGLFAGIWV